MKKTFAEAGLANINGGAIGDQWEEGWDALMANIADANTSPTKVRSLILRIDVKPSEDRTKAETKVSSKLVLCPVLANVDEVYFDFNGVKATAFFVEPGQQELPGLNNVSPLRRTGTEGDKK